MRISRTARVSAALLTTGLALAACGSDEESTSDGADALSGTILIDGSSTVAPLGEAAAELFMESYPGVRVTVGTSGTGGGFTKFCEGETDVSEASRPIKESEITACEAKGIGYDQLTVANDALTIMVNPDNPIDCLTVPQLQQIWAPGATITNWNEIDGIDHDAPLDLYGPGTDSGTFDFFTEAINGESGEQRTDYNNIGEDDNTGIVGVSGTAGGMFYAGFSYFEENKDKVKALQIDSGSGCVEPTMETVKDGTYTPLGRGLFMYPSDKALTKPEVVQFFEFFMENQEAIAEAAGFIGMTDAQAAESAAKVQKLAGN
ncbi:phosphate ABC transporter substrate-binding protein [Nocardia mangyaensis]|uniref:Phosphate-binding protein n=1 Tax=Nocardia mangyaensis TaxID=2213200 RepID=A0A1J0VXA9_9NOCA|nr:PstS family phosphate ABC transporter substrate-binding protein [Nocardia mangyaensis]APE36641.1 phosphate ABC transporter substrate-binding protein [Nocardia mangyaensis]